MDIRLDKQRMYTYMMNIIVTLFLIYTKFQQINPKMDKEVKGKKNHGQTMLIKAAYMEFQQWSPRQASMIFAWSTSPLAATQLSEN